ncbi:hypothetical protein CDAR_244851 [Caerostris darwini]|uniref:Uncharacterized protein n=1 Tax=Caerostris darwini TaxID=1538125 RepID=A0AAV4WVY3_9ARAC|nr:hypothetical protein CDAR_244851 [Caerostris darwini]
MMHRFTKQYLLRNGVALQAASIYEMLLISQFHQHHPSSSGSLFHIRSRILNFNKDYENTFKAWYSLEVAEDEERDRECDDGQDGADGDYGGYDGGSPRARIQSLQRKNKNK